MILVQSQFKHLLYHIIIEQKEFYVIWKQLYKCHVTLMDDKKNFALNENIEKNT
jgi:hypothetical protein